MSKWTYLLLLLFFGVICILSFILFSPTNIIWEKTPLHVSVTPIEPQTMLSFSPQNLLVVPGETNYIFINIDTGSNSISTVQFEIGYDPTALTSVDINPGTFIVNPLVPLRIIDTKNGRASYALQIPDGATQAKGKGIIAILSFIPNLSPGEMSRITFLPKTTVNAYQNGYSLLKGYTNANILLKQ